MDNNITKTITQLFQRIRENEQADFWSKIE